MLKGLQFTLARVDDMGEEPVRCEIENVVMSTQGPVVLLVPEDRPNQILPIFIDHSQAFNIQTALKGHVPPRPMTHDLMNHVLQEMGGVVERIVVEDLAQSTFFASLYVELETDDDASDVRQFDARPSDGLALAVRAHAPVFVDDDILDDAAISRADIEGESLKVEETDEDIDLGVEP
jgi:bifunctional DNase/RNase